MKRLAANIWRRLGLSKSVQLAVMRLTQDEFLIGVSGVIFDGEGRILVCKHTYRSHQWSLPGGYIKAGEHPQEGLAREIEEETGLVVHVNDILKVRTDRQTARIEINCIGTLIGGQFTPSAEVESGRFFAFENLPILTKDQIVLIHEAMEKVKKSNASKEMLEKKKSNQFTKKIASFFRR